MRRKIGEGRERDGRAAPSTGLQRRVVVEGELDAADEAHLAPRDTHRKWSRSGEEAGGRTAGVLPTFSGSVMKSGCVSASAALGRLSVSQASIAPMRALASGPALRRLAMTGLVGLPL